MKHYKMEYYEIYFWKPKQLLLEKYQANLNIKTVYQSHKLLNGIN